MPASAHHLSRPQPRHVAHPRPRLRAVESHSPRRLPSARTVALYAVGLTLGFLLAAVASAPGGAAVVGFQMQLASLAGVTGVLALLRARTVARGRTRSHTAV